MIVPAALSTAVTLPVPLAIFAVGDIAILPMSPAIALVSVAAGAAVFVAAASLVSVFEPHAARAAVRARTDRA